MYDEDLGTPAQARFPYGTRSSEVEPAATNQMAMDLEVHDGHFARSSGQNGTEIELEVVTASKDNSYSYEAESPDEGAFLVPAREFGFEFCRRTQSSIFIRERDPSSQEFIEREFKLLNLLDFTSKRKRMSVIVQDETGQILLLCKGADRFTCSLLRQGMKQICISTNVDMLNQDFKRAVKENIVMQMTNGSQMIKLEKDPHAAFALIIDGKTLTYALEEDLKHEFLKLAVDCASVICCRVYPKQKAMVRSFNSYDRLVKEGTGKTTLAIGNGANDVGMIQEADIGVGISGVEGMQAVMASDFAIAQFRFLERLLVVHGHWCYKRIAQMICYFFYKNIAFGLTLFYFEAFTGFSGQSVYDDWYMLLFNIVLTSLPVIALAVFEQDVSSEICLQVEIG
ncbi:hypothetical protein E3N88_22689 [Mikania micrantha]|uniref:P-type phospholipid transporter n=1 Tax=Mikania micrantha TaxID=192012 RepID=A0A5N6NDP3_9ASTR|nr:hypothetical protein E3N88_22689 [Mikania micrantha]